MQAAMAILYQASLLTIALLYVGHVVATGRAPGVIVADDTITVRALFEMGGVTGFVQFSQKNRNDPVEIHVNLEGLDQFTDSYPWHVHEYPIRYSLLNDYPCSQSEVGGHYDPLGAFNNPNYATDCNMNNLTACEVGDFSGKLGRLANDQPWQTFIDPSLSLYGPLSIIGRSLVIHRGNELENRWICANIEYPDSDVKILRASLRPSVASTYQGDVVIHKVNGRDDATVYVDVRSNDISPERQWNLRLGRGNITCGNFDMLIYGQDPSFVYGSCSSTNQRACPIGDFTSKCGRIILVGGNGRVFCTDNQLGSIPTGDLFSPHNVQPISVVITNEFGGIDACGELTPEKPRQARAILRSSTIYGDIALYQASPSSPTMITTYVTGLRGTSVSLEIRAGGDCSNLGNLLRSPGPPIVGRPISARKTGDATILGNLSPIIPIPPNSYFYKESTSTIYLPLFGPHSVVNNTIVLVDEARNPLACGLIMDINPRRSAPSFMGF